MNNFNSIKKKQAQFPLNYPLNALLFPKNKELSDK